MNPETEQSPTPTIHSTCPICLEPAYSDLALIDTCFHAFCLFCILQWTEFQRHVYDNHKKIPTCPICRTDFTSLLTHLNMSQQTYERISIIKESPPHWSQFYKTNEPTHKALKLSLHHRRLVYTQNLQPMLEFDIIPITMTKKLSLKLDSWLQRELCLLLRHKEMTLNYANSQLQQEETLIVSELIKALVLEHASELHTLLLHNTVGKGIQKMTRELQKFFFDKTEKFIKELAAFIHSPYNLHAYDHNVKYTDPPIHAHPSALQIPSATHTCTPERNARSLHISTSL